MANGVQSVGRERRRAGHVERPTHAEGTVVNEPETALAINDHDDGCAWCHDGRPGSHTGRHRHLDVARALRASRSEP